MTEETPAYEQDLQAIKEAQRVKALSDLESAQKEAAYGFETEKSTIKPAFKEARREASAQSQLGAKSFAEYAANRGLSNSGVAGEAEIRRQGALQSTLGGLATEEASAISDIAKRENLAGQQFEQQRIGTEAGLESEYLTNLLNQRNVQQSFDENVRQFDTQQDNIDREYQFSQVQYKDAIDQRDWERAFQIQEYQDNLKLAQEQLNVARTNAATSRMNAITSRDSNSSSGLNKTGDTVEVDGSEYNLYQDSNGSYYYEKNGQYVPVETSASNTAGTSDDPGFLGNIQNAIALNKNTAAEKKELDAYIRANPNSSLAKNYEFEKEGFFSKIGDLINGGNKQGF